MERPRVVLPASLEWKAEATFMCELGFGRRRLVVFVKPLGSRWAAFAVATEAPTRRQRSEAKRLSKAGGAPKLDIIPEHGHDLIGLYASPAEAFAVCESYAGKWCANLDGIEACACGPILKAGNA